MPDPFLTQTRFKQNSDDEPPGPNAREILPCSPDVLRHAVRGCSAPAAPTYRGAPWPARPPSRQTNSELSSMPVTTLTPTPSPGEPRRRHPSANSSAAPLPSAGSRAPRRLLAGRCRPLRTNARLHVEDPATNNTFATSGARNLMSDPIGGESQSKPTPEPPPPGAPSDGGTTMRDATDDPQSQHRPHRA